MNRSILIVICDFLLVSLLAFSAIDINEAPDKGAPQMQTDISTNRVDSGQDLAVVMRQALDEERRERDRLLGELSRSRENIGQQETQLNERQRQIQAFQQDLASRDEQARQLRQEQSSLQQQLGLAQTNVYALQTQLRSTSAEMLRARDDLAQKEAELKRRAELAAALQKQVDDLARSNQFVLNERQRIAGQLQLAEVEKRHATEQAARLEEQVKVERQEKARLADGVEALASRSGQLAQEIRENRPLNPNTIFNELVANRVQASLGAERPTFLGIDSNRRRGTATVLVAHGTNIYAVTHVSDTPFKFWSPGTDWASLYGDLNRNGKTTQVQSLSFHSDDPRVVYIPVTPAQAAELGVKPYKIASDPYKFEDAVIIGAQEGYYGEAKFEIDLSTPGYVKLDRNVLKGLFGQFNPSRGDLVLSKSGEMLGIMANNSYCLMLKNFNATATFQFAGDTRSQRTGTTLSYLYGRVAAMPPRLQ